MLSSPNANSVVVLDIKMSLTCLSSGRWDCYERCDGQVADTRNLCEECSQRASVQRMTQQHEPKPTSLFSYEDYKAKVMEDAKKWAAKKMAEVTGEDATLEPCTRVKDGNLSR